VETGDEEVGDEEAAGWVWLARSAPHTVQVVAVDPWAAPQLVQVTVVPLRKGGGSLPRASHAARPTTIRDPPGVTLSPGRRVREPWPRAGSRERVPDVDHDELGRLSRAAPASVAIGPGSGPYPEHGEE
jgi:hypothetical protein